MKFSILIAHYNNYNYFLDCYKSILAQTHQNYEVIIVDDCSTDDSFGKLTELLQNDSRFKLYQNTENRGVGYTKRRCAELATGEICGFVDPDDAIAKDALEKSISGYENTEIVATHSQIKMCDKDLNFVKNFPNIKPIPYRKPTFLNINFSLNHFFTFRKSAYEKTSGINPELTSAVDQDLYLKIYETGKIQLINSPLYFYRLHEKGVSQEKSKKNKLNKNWDTVLGETLQRRNITKIYGKKINEIDNLPQFIFKKENSLLKKIVRKFL